MHIIFRTLVFYPFAIHNTGQRSSSKKIGFKGVLRILKDDFDKIDFSP